MTINANEIAALYNGQTNRLKKPEEKYQRKTVADMTKRIVEDIDKTIHALENYSEVSKEGHVQPIRHLPENPMAKLVQNGFQVKVGYGDKNEAIPGFFDKDEKGNLELPKFWTAEDAVAYCNRMKTLIQDGEVDGQFDQMLASYRKRSQAGTEALHAVAA